MGVLFNNTLPVSGLIQSYPFTISSSDLDQSIVVPYASPDYILIGLTIVNGTDYINMWRFRDDYITGFYLQNDTVHFVRKSTNYWASCTAYLYFIKL